MRRQQGSSVYVGPLPNTRSEIDAESVSVAVSEEMSGNKASVGNHRIRRGVSFEERTEGGQGEGQPVSAMSDSADTHQSTPPVVSDKGVTGGEDSRQSRSAVLSRAENLLARVKGSLRDTSVNKTQDTISERHSDRYTLKGQDDEKSFHADVLSAEVLTSINDWASGLTRKHTVSSGTHTHTGSPTNPQGTSASPRLPRRSHLDEVEWLLRGVPEIYDDDAYIDDEVVDRLIQQGGLPPSQIAFPSLYEASQRTLKSLQDVKRLQVTITALTIHSARYGLRKHGSYIVIRCPSGCKGTSPDSAESRTVMVDLPHFQADKGPDTGKHKNVLKDYVVGMVSLDISVVWNVLLTDGVLRDWLQPSTSHVNGYVHIELYSHLSPSSSAEPSRGTGRRGVRGRDGSTVPKQPSVPPKATWSEPGLLLGFADIPLDHLLSTTALSVHVTSEIVVDEASQAAIADRLQRLPTGISLRTARPLQGSMGTMSCTLTLLNEKDELVVGGGRVGALSAVAHHNGKETSSLSATVPATTATIDINRTVIDDALDYAPMDTSVAMGAQDRLSSTSPHNVHFSGAERDGTIATTPTSPVYVGIALHFASIHLNEAALAHLRMPIRNEPIRVVVSYKIALSNGSIRDEIDALLPAHKFTASKPLDIEYSAGRIHEIADMMTWRYVYFEVWLRWRGVVHPETDESKLLGLAKFPVHTNIGEPVDLAVLDPASGRECGQINTTVQFHHRGTTTMAEKLLEKCLTSESVRRMLRTHEIRVGGKSVTKHKGKTESDSAVGEAVDSRAVSKTADDTKTNTTDMSIKGQKPADATTTVATNYTSQPGEKEGNEVNTEVKKPPQDAPPQPTDSPAPAIAPPKVSDEPDMIWSLRASARRSGNSGGSGHLASFTGSIRFSQDSLMGDLELPGGGASAAAVGPPLTHPQDNALGNSIDSLEKSWPRKQDMHRPERDTRGAERDGGVSEDKGRDGTWGNARDDDMSGTLLLKARHILDINVEGGFRQVWNDYVSSANSDVAEEPLGCFLCYKFPGLRNADVESWVR